jgi:hypothetical protein
MILSLILYIWSRVTHGQHFSGCSCCTLHRSSRADLTFPMTHRTPAAEDNKSSFCSSTSSTVPLIYPHTVEMTACSGCSHCAHQSPDGPQMCTTMQTPRAYRKLSRKSLRERADHTETDSRPAGHEELQSKSFVTGAGRSSATETEPHVTLLQL